MTQNDISQHFFNDLYFNLKSRGCTSTTWTWDGIRRLHSNGLIFFNWLIMPDKSAIELNERGEATGRVEQLR